MTGPGLDVCPKLDLFLSMGSEFGLGIATAMISSRTYTLSRGLGRPMFGHMSKEAENAGWQRPFYRGRERQREMERGLVAF